MRATGRPIAMSGSGPTLFALYAARDEAEAAAQVVRAAVEGGAIPSIGDGAPTITVTTIPDHHEEPPS